MAGRLGRIRWRYALVAGCVLGGASMAQPLPMPGQSAAASPVLDQATDFSVLTYNVKGLPWPIARDRGGELARIAGRLAQMRREGRQPSVVVLQEAFTAEAKAIGRQAGYAYQVHGPYARPGPGVASEAGGEWQSGETGAAMVDSGLVILSDLPVLGIDRAAFPQGACAGFDCLAAKGVVMLTVEVPGKGPVAIAATHFNSRKASGTQFARTHAAYRRQAEFLGAFIARHHNGTAPLVLAGDFNRGQRAVRIAALAGALGGLAGDGQLREALRETVTARTVAAASGEAGWIVRRARDMQFRFDGARARLAPVSATIPFGREADGSMLSDHMGFTIAYRVLPVDRAESHRPAAVSRLAAATQAAAPSRP